MPGVGTGNAERAERLEVALLVGDLAGALDRLTVGNGDGGKSRADSGGLEVIALKSR